jgi:hypothetical protein
MCGKSWAEKELETTKTSCFFGQPPNSGLNWLRNRKYGIGWGWLFTLWNLPFVLKCATLGLKTKKKCVA